MSLAQVPVIYFYKQTEANAKVKDFLTYAGFLYKSAKKYFFEVFTVQLCVKRA